MIDRRQATAPSAPAGPLAQTESGRSLLLEFRLEQLRSALDEARANADQARTRLAEAAVREADQTRRHGLLQDELARAREEVNTLHRRLEQSEALRAELAGHLFESEVKEDAQELIRLRQEVELGQERALANERTAAQLRARVDELVASRETLLTRVVEWAQAVRNGDPDAVDLGEFIAKLRRAILDLERENALGEQREAALRQRLDQAGEEGRGKREEHLGTGDWGLEEKPQPPTPSPQPLPTLETSLAAAQDPQEKADLLLRLSATGGDSAFYAVRPCAADANPIVRAAAYQALGRLLEGDPARLEPHIRWGIADPNPRVRRRAVLAAGAARGLDVRSLLEPLTGDPDPQVRRVVHQILRRGPSTSFPSPVGRGVGVRSMRIVRGS